MSEKRVVYHDGMLPPSVGTGEFEESLTRQSEVADADINTIMSRYERSGLLPGMQREGLFMDVSGIGDYRDALERVMHAQEVFAALPAKVRERFKNDPAALVDFAVDPKNEEEMFALGLLERKEEVKPVGVPPAGPPKA